MNKLFTLLAFLMFSLGVNSQNDTLKALFLGNSYTAQNNLPALVQSFSSGANKTLITDRNTPGGYTFDLHTSNSVSMSKIALGTWDVVVLQEQSQIPTIDFYRYGSMYPACKRLNDSIKKYNPCAKVILYMTWGRRFGGQQCDNGNVNCSPVFRDFNHMQDSLEQAYRLIADTIGASVAPVGIAWKNILNDTNLVLHSSDNSHPSYLGSFVAAATLYQAIWNQSMDSSNYQGSLSSSLSTYINRNIDTTVLDSAIKWRLKQTLPPIDFSYSISGDTVSFTNLTTNSALFKWNWLLGDGTTVNSASTSHQYTQAGTYQVELVREYCGQFDTLSKSILIHPTSLIESQSDASLIYPNPFTGQLNIEFKQKEVAHISIINLLGKVEESFEIQGKSVKTLNLSTLKNGLYFLEIRQGKEAHIVKLIKH